MGDAGLTVDEAYFNFDGLLPFYSNFLAEIANNQQATGANAGAVPDTVPWSFGNQEADPSWGSAFPNILYGAFRWKGCVSVESGSGDSVEGGVHFG